MAYSAEDRTVGEYSSPRPGRKPAARKNIYLGMVSFFPGYGIFTLDGSRVQPDRCVPAVPA
jgi:hypothetical protein